MRTYAKVWRSLRPPLLALSACGRGSDSRLRLGQRLDAGPPAASPTDALIGVALPQKTSENWVLAESLFNDGLKAAGFKADVQFANGRRLASSRTRSRP